MTETYTDSITQWHRLRLMHSIVRQKPKIVV